MTSLSRRTFVKGIVATPLALWLSRNAWATDPYIRYDCASGQGQAMLAIYADAVRAMQASGPDNTLSWMWQWYTHFVDGTTTKANEITRLFGDPTTPQGALANETWNTCQSHSGQNTNNFFPWHRMFVFFFEQIVRQASGHPEFTLPYWDYTSADPLKRGILPVQFRLPADPVFGSLYRPDRTSLANSGQRIDKNQPTDVMDISAALRCTSYSNVGSVQGFCRAIDSGIHGRIHTLVGTSKNMGAVPYAARDPLFWVHHGNIDRMWASWNYNGGPNPTASWANKAFVFVDGTGQRVTGKLKDFFDTSLLGYGYDSLIPPPVQSAQASTLAAAAAPGGRPERVAAARGEADLGAKPVHVPLLPLAGAKRTAVLGLDPDQPGKRAYLVLRELHTWSQPEVLFHLYLSPARGGTALSQENYVGNINFFDAEFHDHGNGAMADVIGENFYSFDVTDILRGFERSGTRDARESLLLTIAPAGRPAGGQPMVGVIELVRQ